MSPNEIRDDMPETQQLICSICGNAIETEPLSGWSGGHNAEPINSGRCCGDCNTRVVVPERFRRLYARQRRT